MKDRRALCVHSDPLAGCGPCGRPPLQDNQFPIWGAALVAVRHGRVTNFPSAIAG